MKNLQKVLLILCMFASASHLFANNQGPNANASAPSPLDKDFKQSDKMGEDTIYKIIIPAYDISLWSQKKPWSYDHIFSLQVKCRWNATKKEMVDNTMDVMKEDQQLDSKLADQYTSLLLSFYPDLSDGDRVTVIFFPGKSLDFYHNDKLVKQVTDMVFAKHFCDIWLGSTTRYKSARKSLLDCDN